MKTAAVNNNIIRSKQIAINLFMRNNIRLQIGCDPFCILPGKSGSGLKNNKAVMCHCQ
jgi:hypothetical protein